MFYLRYLGAELRRRKGRTILTATSLALGVGLVVAVTSLSAGLDDAQSEVLEPLTGVGTEMSVTRPQSTEDGGLPVPDAGGGPIGLDNLGDPGERFDSFQYVSTDTSFGEPQAAQGGSGRRGRADNRRPQSQPDPHLRKGSRAERDRSARTRPPPPPPTDGGTRLDQLRHDDRVRGRHAPIPTSACSPARR